MRVIVLYLAAWMFLPSLAGAQSTNSSDPLVHLTTGTVKGKLAATMAEFDGIPFAAPPLGELRWREPQPVQPWSGVRDATKPSHPCIQGVLGTDSFVAPLAATYGAAYVPVAIDPSEDCLYLNLWTPDLHSNSGLPVMVWLHGGSNRVGSGAEPGYDGTSLASHGVIVVTVNYRLGVMGFFSHPELTAESPHHSSGNYGLLDQIAALRWVQQNIAQFGGDPANVTVFGESAGAVDITTLITSPLTSNLFKRVIAESGTAFGLGAKRTMADMAPLGEAVGKAAGGQPGAELGILRHLPAAQVVKIEDTLIASAFKGADPNGSIIDGWVLPESPARAYALGQIQKVDLLAGLNAREFSAFRIAAAAAAKKAPEPARKPGFSETVKQVADVARPLYGNWTDLAVATYSARILLHGTTALDQTSNDIIGACPVGAEAALTTSAGRRAFVYRFDRSVPGKGESELGSFHSLELPYVFGTFQARTFSWLPFSAIDHKLSQTIQAYWTNFAKSGDPNGPGLSHWAQWDTDHEPYLSFAQSGDAVSQQGLSPIFCHLSPNRLKAQLANY